MPSTSHRKVRPIFHITPQNDMYRHTLDATGSCWCCPHRDDDDPEEIYYLHNAYDRREEYEDGRRLPN